MKYEMNGQFKETFLNTTDLMNHSSVHGWVRTMERTDKSDRQALRMIQNAWSRGKSIDQLKFKKQRKYVASRYSLLLDGYTNLKVYCDHLFIFSATGCLITMYPLPKNFSKKRSYDGKTMVRDIRKYQIFRGKPHSRFRRSDLGNPRLALMLGGRLSDSLSFP